MSMKDPAKVAAAEARAAALTPEQRREIAKTAARRRWDNAGGIAQAAYTGTLDIGNMSFPCSVLSDGTRVLTQSDFMNGMGMYYSGWVSKNRPDEDVVADLPQFLSFKSLKPFVDKHLCGLPSIIVNYRTERGSLARGIRADIIPRICDIWLDADEHSTLGIRQKSIAAKARLLMRALAHVGIIALVDEATGYQEDRARDALQRILEAFIAKELQPWVRTFPDDYYRELFRLRGLEFPTDTVKRPQYFGHITNNIVYKRLAPGVLQELKRATPRAPRSGRHSHQLHRRLTRDIGHPKLREYMASLITVMKLSTDYEDFMRKLNRIHQPYNETISLDFGQLDDAVTEVNGL